MTQENIELKLEVKLKAKESTELKLVQAIAAGNYMSQAFARMKAEMDMLVLELHKLRESLSGLDFEFDSEVKRHGQ